MAITLPQFTRVALGPPLLIRINPYAVQYVAVNADDPTHTNIAMIDETITVTDDIATTVLKLTT